jgi:hypothetical protein
VAEIDEKLTVLDSELSRYEQLLAERERLRAARATLLGEGRPPQISQDHVAGYLAEHPGSKAGAIAQDLRVPLSRVSSHLYRGGDRFERRKDGWHLADQRAGKPRDERARNAR